MVYCRRVAVDFKHTIGIYIYKAANDETLYRRATHNRRRAFPNDLAGQRVCFIWWPCFYARYGMSVHVYAAM